MHKQCSAVNQDMMIDYELHDPGTAILQLQQGTPKTSRKINE